VPTLPGVDELAALVVADQQRTQPDSAALRGGIAADHELSIEHAFELQPIRRAPPRVSGISQFGDHAFVAALAGLAVGGLAFVPDVGGQAQRIAKLKRIAQQAFPPNQGQRGGVLAVEVQQVENVVEHRDARRMGLLRIGDPEAALQPGETRAPPLLGVRCALSATTLGAV
jgi:hypothetical protein